jgi:hypothetical protein
MCAVRYYAKSLSRTRRCKSMVSDPIDFRASFASLTSAYTIPIVLTLIKTHRVNGKSNTAIAIS